MFTPDQIFDELEKTPQYFRPDVAKRFLGLPMDCELVVFNRYRNQDDTVDVTLKLPDEKDLSVSVEIKIDPAVSPFIKFDPDGTSYRVCGLIKSVTRWRIELENASITKPGQPVNHAVVLGAANSPLKEDPILTSLAHVPDSTPRGFWRTLWGKLSSEERAAVIGVIGTPVTAGCIAAAAWIWSTSTRAKTENAVTPASSTIFSPSASPTATAQPSTSAAPTASAASNSLSPNVVEGASRTTALDQYYENANQYGKRLAARDAFNRSLFGQHVNWRGLVVDTSMIVNGSASIYIRTDDKSHNRGMILPVKFKTPSPQLIEQIRALESDDLIEFSGTIVEGTISPIAIDAEGFQLIKAAASAP